MVGHLQIQLMAKVRQAAQIFIWIIGAENDSIDQREVIARTVADEHLPVAVEDLTARGRDACAIGV